MVPEYREKYNREFTEQKYINFLNDLWSFNNGIADFRVSETPLFIDQKFTNELIKACEVIVEEIQQPGLQSESEAAIPNKFKVPCEDKHPLFLQFDFAVATDKNGNSVPRLIELQGFPSLYAFQAFLAENVKKHYSIDDSLTSYFNGLDHNSYINLLRESILDGHSPENVILLEISPEIQKTRIDFYYTEKYFGIKSVCITDLIVRNKNIFYKLNGKEIPVKRIYNRVIFDEYEKKGINSQFNFLHDYNVSWAGHPNWFFKISKYTIPFLKNEFVPDCYFLKDVEKYPEDLENYVLKPLFSFAGSGVIIDLDKETLKNIKNKENYILQKKVNYTPVIKTPDQYAKAEIRMMFIWKDKPFLVNNLLRTTKGKMVGVDYNKNKTWIGSNIVFHPI